MSRRSKDKDASLMNPSTPPSSLNSSHGKEMSDNSSGNDHSEK